MMDIHQVLIKLAADFHRTPEIFLTEGDLQAHLFMRLHSLPELRQLGTTLDGQRSISLHSEVSYFGKNNRLEHRVDLAVINTAELNCYVGESPREGRRPGKGFAFGDSVFGIEVKLNRYGTERVVKKGLLQDIRKLQKLSERNPGVTFIVYYFDKRSALRPEVLSELSKDCPGVEVIYVNRQDIFVVSFFTQDRQWNIRPYDVDNWPSKPHGHHRDRREKLNVYTGNVYDILTGNLKRNIGKKELERIRSDPRLKPHLNDERFLQ